VIEIKNIFQFDFDNIPIDTFWNTGTDKESKMHRIHAYPAKFPAFITTKAIEYMIGRKQKIEKIADIFCGCGTVALEARRHNINFWGCDINPVATLIAKAKSFDYNLPKLNNYFDSIVGSFYNNGIHIDYESAPSRIKYWYSEVAYTDLMRLKNSIDLNIPHNNKYKYFFLCAFSNILKNTSRWLTKSIKPQIDPRKKSSDVLTSFELQYKFMKKAVLESTITGVSNVNIYTGNFLDSKLEKPIVDLIVSSPPYVTSYEYADLHQLSTLWLGYKNDYRELREGSIGSLYHISNLSDSIEQLNSTGRSIVSELMKNNNPKARSVAKYFLDMQQVANSCRQMVSKNGSTLFVLGNTEYGGVKIDNVKHLCESLKLSGFEEIRVSKRTVSGKILTPYRDKKGRFSSNSKNRKVYAEEFIIMGN
jgi:methylase of polypeptide subunit release factors